ncbi:MAG: class I SAM-dependent methyltransferase [Betaproteobacteria bacterium]|nr:class I SAM-dependent methyltransferase [Betaproteobacteria bacterium]
MSNQTLGVPDVLRHYILSHGVREHPAQTALREATRAHPHAVMQISPEQGQFMALLVQLINATRTIEVGVFTGYSALSVALALPDNGRVLACDVSEEFTAIGKPFWRDAGVADKIDLRIAPATDTLDHCLQNGRQGHYDFAFIDADKPNYDTYYERCLALVRVGGLIAIDNTLWSGRVADAPTTHNADTAALHALNLKLHADTRVDVALLPIGDGLTLARKR